MLLEPTIAGRRSVVGPCELLRLFLGTAVTYLLTGLLLGVVLVVRDAFVPGPAAWSVRWLHVHLILAMGVTQAIIGVTQLFATAFLAVTPPARRVVHGQWLFANAGALIMLGGGLSNHLWVVALGGLPLLAAAALLFWSLYDMGRRSLNGIELNLLYYLTAVGFVLAGMTLGILLAAGLTGPLYGPNVRLAHMHLNLIGFVTLTIVGTLHTFFPTLAGVRLYSWPLAAWTYGLLTGGTLLTSAGFLFGWTPVVLIGGLGEVAGSVALVFNLWRTRLAAGRLPLSARHLYAAAWFLLISNLVGTELVGRSPSPGVLTAVTHLALVGFIGQALVGALLRLAPIASRPGRSLGAVAEQGAMGWTADLEFWLFNAGLVGYAACGVAAGLLPAQAVLLGYAGLVLALCMSLGFLMGLGLAMRSLFAATA